MTGSVGGFVVRRARLVLVVAMLAVVGFGVLGVGAFGKLKTGGFQDTGAESTTAQTLTDQRFGGSDGVVLLVHAEAGTVDDAPARAAGAEAATRLAEVPGVSDVVSYWQTRDPGLRSKDGRYALVLGSISSDTVLSSSELDSLRSRSGQADVTVGGSAAIDNDMSMDYEVIVLSRIKELHDQGRDNRTAVTEGLTRSGRIVTTAAALIAVTFFAFGTATVSFLQLFGIGAGFAVLIDATLVRAVLVPACQRILGRAAWYAPAPLRRLQTRIGLAEAHG
jgi:uncharacterized membrane protein YdfJ with MMPL/SSD domain